ncbi:hypothetical protein ABIE91_006704 [Bradyrhizobium elkanii]
MRTCGDCRSYDREFEHEGKKYGFCFRFPPTALAENKSTAPLVQRELRECGEFKPKPKVRTKAKARVRK